MKEYNKRLIRFLNASPTAFHAVNNVKAVLRGEGFQELYEGSH